MNEFASITPTDVTSTSTSNSANPDSHTPQCNATTFVFVILALLSLSSAIYGIYAGNELDLLWSTFSPDDINAACQGQYETQFRVECGRNNQSKKCHWDLTAEVMVIFGIITAGCFCLTPCCIVCPKIHQRSDEEDEGAIATCMGYLVLAAMFWIYIGAPFSWFVLYIKCLTLHDRVQQFCDEDSVVYQDTMEIFDWFYPLVIWEIVKGCCLICACVVWTGLAVYRQTKKQERKREQ